MPATSNSRPRSPPAPAVGAVRAGSRAPRPATASCPRTRRTSSFPTLAEQFGFLGALFIILLYGLLVVLGIDVSFSTTEPFGRLFVVGVVALLAGQGFLNMAMSIGLMPITGIPLPLMSYGGSSLVSTFLALGLVCNVALRRLFLIAPRPFEWRRVNCGM